MTKPYTHFVIAAIFTGLTIGSSLALESGGLRPLRLLGIFFALFALVFFSTPPFTLRKYGEIKRGESFLDTQVVVEKGLLGIVRHPQYLGYIFLLITFMLLAQRQRTTLFGLLGTLFFYLHTKQEEVYCLTRFGADYQAYMRRVPRLNIFSGLVRWRRRNK